MCGDILIGWGEGQREMLCF